MTVTQDNLSSFMAAFPNPVIIMIAVYNSVDHDFYVMNIAEGAVFTAKRVIFNLPSDSSLLKNIRSQRFFSFAIADEIHIRDYDLFARSFETLSNFASDSNSNDNENIIRKFMKSYYSGVCYDNYAPWLKSFPLSVICRFESASRLLGEVRVTGKVDEVLINDKILNDNGIFDLTKFNSAMSDILVPVESQMPISGSIIYRGCGENKIAVIKVIREILKLGLIEAKKFTDTPPQIIKSESKETLLYIAHKLKEAGAVVELI
ncbi:MAG: ribosomal protein L7/L12 [Synergistaceae bacterium]|nr:ribosomal protein L7/L12 [Synergistaceae bacterium]